MGVRTALRRSIGSVTSTPLLLGVGLVYGVVAVALAVPSLVGNTALSLASSVASLGVTLFVLPLLVGGLVGLAHAGLSGRDTGVGTFLRAARENYLYLFAFALVLGAIELAWGTVVGVVLYLVGIFVAIAAFVGLGATGGAGLSAATVVVGALLFFVFAFLFYLIAGLPALVVQFVPGAWIVEDRGFADGLKRGVSLLGRDPKSVVAFDLSLFGVSLLASIAFFFPLAVVGVVLGPEALIDGSLTLADPMTGTATGVGGTDPGAGATPQSAIGFSPLAIGIYVLTALVVTPVQTAFLSAYYAAFYDELRSTDRDADDGGPDAASTAEAETGTDARSAGDAPA